MLEEIESNGGYSSLFQSEEFFFSSDAEFRESGGVLIDSTEINEDMIISEERVDQTSSHPCKGFIKNLEYFDDCNRAVSEVVERYLWSTSNSAWFSVDCQEFGKWKKIRAS